MAQIHIQVDPLTRIEGHLRMEAAVDGGKIVDAWSSSTMFRGVEIILKGRDPRDAWAFTQRICGVCTSIHSLASVRCIENALGIEIPPNARIVRNLIEGLQHVHDHLVHFYHLHALDWVDIVSAIGADPEAASRLAQSISDWPLSSTDYFAGIQSRLKRFVEGGQLGPFTNGYWGHSAYALPAEANLMAVAHYLEALDLQRKMVAAHAILGGKNPHPQTFLVGGMAVPLDPNSPNAINADKLAHLKRLFTEAHAFTEQVYIPDLLAVASVYKDHGWGSIGEGIGNFLSYGDFPLRSINEPESYYLPQGIIYNRDLSTVHNVDHTKIQEYVAHSWYEYSAGEAAGVHPWEGETSPRYTGPLPPYQELNIAEKYSWVKAPRYDGKVMEVGPLSNMLVAYARGHERVKALVDMVLGKLGVGPEALFSTLGRTAARAIASLLIAEQLIPWTDDLAANMRSPDLRIHNNERWEIAKWPKRVIGWGHVEAPRGGLGHWVVIEDGAIANYQCVVPTTWNAGPRDPSGQIGPYEASLLGTPIANPEQPLEILRTIHSFDPCMACAVHVASPTERGHLRVQVAG